MDLLTQFKKIINEHQLIQKNDKILIAVSGGVDSVVLLDLLYRVRDEYYLILKIVHLNHCIRGKEADRDQKFVQQLARQYHLPISVKKVDVPKYVKNQKCSLEEGARILRYQFFYEQLQKSRFNYLAVGHNANDQAETILDHFLRGSGIRGLTGMKYSTRQIIRPLLALSRTKIETYAHQRGLKYVTDITNEEIKFKRNKIRHQLIPYLQTEFNPAIVNTLLRTGIIAQNNELYLKKEAERAFNSCLKSFQKNKIILDINQFFNYFNIIQTYVLFHILELLLIDVESLTATKINVILNIIQKKKTGTKIPLAGTWEILIDHSELVVHQNEKIDFEFKICLKKCYKIFGGKKIFTADLIKRDQLPEPLPRQRNIEFIDYKKVTQPLIIRNFRPGDRFIPLNMKGHKKVSDFFTDEKVPLHLRKQIPLLLCPEGIIWVMGYQINDRFKITNKTNVILKLEIRKAINDKQ